MGTESCFSSRMAASSSGSVLAGSKCSRANSKAFRPIFSSSMPERDRTLRVAARWAGIAGAHQPAGFPRPDEHLFRACGDDRAPHAHGLNDIASPGRTCWVRTHNTVYRTDGFFHIVGPVMQEDDVPQAVAIDCALHAALKRRGIGRVASADMHGGMRRRRAGATVAAARIRSMSPRMPQAGRNIRGGRERGAGSRESAARVRRC